jgi:hypothetical protein
MLRRVAAEDQRPAEAPSPGWQGAAAKILARFGGPRWFYPAVAVIAFVLWCTYYRRWPGSAALSVHHANS